MSYRLLATCGAPHAIIAIALAGFASGALGSTVSVSPPDTTVIVGTTFAVRVTVDAVADLKGADLIFAFDPAKLEFQGVDPGDVLTGSGRAFSSFVVPDVAPADSAWYDVAMLDGATSGPGIIGFFRFKALEVGDSPIQCQHVDLRDSNNDPLMPDCVSGLVHITGPTPVRRATWSRLKTLYR